MQKQYVKTNWIDEIPASTPVKYRIVDGASIIHAEVEITPATTITTPGTAITATRLNNLENGVDSLDTLMVNISRETIYLKVLSDDASLSVGDGRMVFTVPAAVNGMNITSVHIAVYTPSSAGVVTVQVHNLSRSSDILSIPVTIDQGEFNSYTAAVPAVVAAAQKNLVTGERIRVDVDGAGTGVRGLDVIILAELP
jgi:hypothetical protein